MEELSQSGLDEPIISTQTIFLSKNYLAIILLVIIGIIISAGIYIIMAPQQNKPSQILPQETPSSRPTTAEAAITLSPYISRPSSNIKGWKTYINEKYKYQVQYPTYLEIYSDSTLKPDGSLIIHDIWASKRKGQVQITANIYKDGTSGLVELAVPTQTEEVVTINEQSVKKTVTIIGPEIVQIVVQPFKNQNLNYVFVFVGKKVYISDFNKMLSTLMFTQ